MTPDHPMVRVVVLNFDGGQMTIDCIDSLLATEWPPDRLEVVMVDNGSLDDAVERVRRMHPGVRIVEPLANLGFAGGCNLGLRQPGAHDLVALVNNDATVAADWLRPLVDVLESDAQLGAVCPKMLFDGRYHEVGASVAGAGRIGADPRQLGVRIVAMRIDGERDDARVSFDEGFYAAEAPHPRLAEEMARWSAARGRLRVRTSDPPPKRLALCVTSIGPRTLTLTTARSERTVDLDGEPMWVEVELDACAYDVINNVGSQLYHGGFGGDRGFLELDHGQYDSEADVFAWCGGAVLMRREYLDRVGVFDESLFLYYEDTDLSWRGRAEGWRYRYTPRSVVRHRHAQSSVVGSPTFRYYTERNRLVVLTKNAPAGVAVRAGVGEVGRFGRSLVRHFVIRPMTLRMPNRAEFRHRRRVLGGYLRALPGALRRRWRRGRIVGRRQLMRWAVPR